MRYPRTRAPVHHHAARLLQEHLRLTDFRSRCPATLLPDLVPCACSWLTSLFAVGQRPRRAPAPETARLALRAWLPEPPARQRRRNRALAADLPRSLRRRRQRLAIDRTLVPYHGQPSADPKEVYRSKAKAGASPFHAYATRYLVLRGQRCTLALTAVARGEAPEGVPQRLPPRAARKGVRPRLVLVDRGFCGVGVIRSLQAARRPFLMPLPLRGRQADHPRGPGGRRVFGLRRRSGRGSYTLTASDGRKARVSACVKCRNLRGGRGKHGRQALVYGYWGFVTAAWDWVRQVYRARFAVETSYRQAQEARAPTSSRSPAVRLLLVGLALVLRNVRVWLHDAVLSTPRRGGRLLRPARLRFKARLGWLAQVAQGRYGVREQVGSERPIPIDVGS